MKIDVHSIVLWYSNLDSGQNWMWKQTCLIFQKDLKNCLNNQKQKVSEDEELSPEYLYYLCPHTVVNILKKWTKNIVCKIKLFIEWKRELNFLQCRILLPKRKKNRKVQLTREMEGCKNSYGGMLLWCLDVFHLTSHLCLIHAWRKV